MAMTYVNSRPTEECPLTKESIYKYKWSSFCGDGLKFIISCFTVLTVAITATLILQLLYTDNTPQDKIGLHGAVASDYANCSQIGTKILRKGGNAVDAAVAATICMTVVAPHKTGLGGGGCIMIYNHKELLDPVLIDFANNTFDGAFSKNGIRLPAVLKGLEYAQHLMGKLPWKEVVKPSISLAYEGFAVSKEFANEIGKNTKYEALYGHLSAGDILRLPDLAETLRSVAKHGASVLYNGTLSHKLLYSNLNEMEQLHELSKYIPEIYETKQATFYGHVIYYSPHSLSFPVMIKELNKLKIATVNSSSVETQLLVAHTLIQSVVTPRYLLETAEEERYTGVIAMDWEDLYVSIITGLGAPFGVGQMTDAGLLLDKDSKRDSPRTFTPIIFHKTGALCGLRGVFAADDVFIAGQILYNIIVRGLNVSTAIEYPRYYFALDGLVVEDDAKDTVDAVIHKQFTSVLATPHTDPSLLIKSVNAITKRKDSMMSHSDSRGGGLSSRF